MNEWRDKVLLKKYLAIYAVTINGERNVEFSYDDPNMQIFLEDDPRWEERCTGEVLQRSLRFKQ